MRILGLGCVLVIGSATLVGCGGGGGGGGGGGSSAPPFTPLPFGVNDTFRPPRFSQAFSSNGSTSTGGAANLLGESVRYQWSGSGNPIAAVGNATISSDSSSSATPGNVTFTWLPGTSNPLGEFKTIVDVATPSVSFNGGEVAFVPSSATIAPYATVGIGAPVPGAASNAPTTQVPRLGIQIPAGAGFTQSLLLADWRNAQVPTTLPNNNGVSVSGPDLSYTMYGRWAVSDGRGGSATVRNFDDRVGAISFGLPTQNMPTAGGATYRGGFIGVYLVGNPSVGSFGQFEADGIVNVTASFANNTFTFNTQNTRIHFSTETSGFSGIDGAARLNVTTSGSPSFTGNSYQAPVTGTGLNGPLTGTVQGRFYGPSAAETGGTFRVQGGVNGTATHEVLIGGYGARQ